MGVCAAFAFALPAPAAASVSRRTADAIAIHALRPARSPSATVLFGLGSPVRAGSAVFEAAPGTTAHVRPLKHATWLFWEDQGFQELFVHPSVLLLVDAKTGKVMRKSQLGWFPLINGRRPAFLASSAAYHDPHYWVASVHLPRVRAGASARAAAPPPVAIKPGELSHDCLVMIGDRHEPILTGSFAAMLQWSRDVGVKSYPDQATNVASLRSTIARARADECDDVFLFIAGHGNPPPGWHDPKTHKVYPGGPAEVNLGSGLAVEQSTGAWSVQSNLLTPDDLKGLIEEFPDVDFKVKIESCFSGRFADALTISDQLRGQVPALANLRVLELSSAPDRPSFGQIKVDKFDRNGRLVAHNVPVNDNPFGAGEFTNGDYHGLESWARSPTEITNTGGDLERGIFDSSSLGLPFNAGTDAHLVSPMLPATPLVFHQPFDLRAHLASHTLSDGFDVTGWTHGRFDTVTVFAPPGHENQILSYDAHGHTCDLIDNHGNVVPSGTTLQPGQYIVAVRCQRKPTDDDIHIDIQLASGGAADKSVKVRIEHAGQPQDYPLTVHQ